MSKNKKKISKRAREARKKNTQRKQNVNITVHVKQQEPVNALTVVPQSALNPIKEGGKYMMAPSWLSEKQVLRMLQRTPPQYIYNRPGKGGKNWDYVPVGYIEKVLNYVFGWNWDFEIIKQEMIGEQIVCLGKLIVKDDKGHLLGKCANGRADIKFLKDKPHKPEFYLDIGNDYKASASDALKKAASLLGIASDIYHKQEFNEVGVVIKNGKPVDKPTTQPGQNKSNHPIIEAECHECGNPITKAEAEFSKKIFKKPLCRPCQTILKQQTNR
jgi:hypothetical protein